jgi:magnesium chelatase family protein
LDSAREMSQLLATRQRVWHAAEVRRKREWRFTNVELPTRPRSVTDILERDGFHPDARRQLQRVAITMRLSARSYAKTARVARTIADLEGEILVGPAHVLEAAQYRSERW